MLAQQGCECRLIGRIGARIALAVVQFLAMDAGCDEDHVEPLCACALDVGADAIAGVSRFACANCSARS